MNRKSVDGLTEGLPQDTGTFLCHVPSGYKLNSAFIETKSRRVSLLIQPSLMENVRDLAQKNGTSVNETICIAIREYLERTRAEPVREPL